MSSSAHLVGSSVMLRSRERPQKRDGSGRVVAAWVAFVCLALALGAALILPHACRVKPTAPYVGVRSKARPFGATPVGSAVFDTSAVPPVLTVRGTAAERGRAIGSALRPQIEHLRDEYLSRYFEGDRDRAESVARDLAQALDDDERAEIDGVADGAGISRADALLFNTFLDIKIAVGCTVLFADTVVAPQGPLMGRNLDFGSFGVADSYDILLVQQWGDGRHSFASVTWPGVVGVLSGMNDRGVSVAILVSGDGRRGVRGLPVLFLLRRILERASDAAQAESIMRAARPASANNVMVVDASGGAFVAEVSPDAVAIRRPDGGLLAAANSFLTPEQHGRGECRRYRALIEGASRKRGSLDVAGMQELLSRVGLGPINLQSMVFDPRRQSLWLSTEQTPASSGVYRQVDIGSLLRGRGR